MIHYRTLIGELSLALILLVGLRVAGASPLAAGVYTIFAISVAGLGAWLAGKSTLEHAANGKGLQAGMRNILTESTPNDPPAPPSPPPQPPVAP